LPGAAAWDEQRDAPLCEGIGQVFVVVEPDKGGAATLLWLSRSSIASRPRIIRTSPELKDPSELYLANPKPAKPEPNRRPKTKLFLGRAGNFG
jgi:hypothetical protein